MKNQYFGDINDYKKYGILRTLAEGGSRKIALCWMLTGDDGRTDGRFTAYLKQPHRWRSFDPELFDSLRNLVLNEGRRRIELVSSARLIRGSVSFSNALSDTGRDLYFTKFRETAGNASLVFFCVWVVLFCRDFHNHWP